MVRVSGYCKEVPTILSIGGLLNYFEEHGKPTIDILARALVMVGRNNMPELLFELWSLRLLSKPAATRCASMAWSACEFPQSASVPEEHWCHATEAWESLFWWIGFTCDGRKASPPSEPLQLYRGAAEVARDGMSWTSDVERARWFADRTTLWFPNSPGKVWTSTFRPDQLLAFIHESSRGESEYVVAVDYNQVIVEL